MPTNWILAISFTTGIDMPELPEVETVRKALLSLVGKEIESIDIYYDKIVEDKEGFQKNVIGKTILDMKRYGKYLLFELENGYIVSHLRMEGKYFYSENKPILLPHIHVVFRFHDSSVLCYQDVRKFGRMMFKKKEELYQTKPFIDLGIDPILCKEIEIWRIYDKIRKKHIPIKTILLDQSILCGLGNIYADEVLYASHILPTREGSSLKLEEVEAILNQSRIILSKAIEYKGTTIRSYTSSLNVKGEYQQFLMVHTKNICPFCMKTLEKKKISGRTTYFCKECQK